VRNAGPLIVQPRPSTARLDSVYVTPSCTVARQTATDVRMKAGIVEVRSSS